MTKKNVQNGGFIYDENDERELSANSTDFDDIYKKIISLIPSKLLSFKNDDKDFMKNYIYGNKVNNGLEGDNFEYNGLKNTEYSYKTFAEQIENDLIKFKEIIKKIKTNNLKNEDIDKLNKINILITNYVKKDVKTYLREDIAQSLINRIEGMEGGKKRRTKCSKAPIVKQTRGKKIKKGGKKAKRTAKKMRS